jgi:hypothetical protein
MQHDLADLIEHLRGIRQASELFGTLADDQRTNLRRKYHQLVAQVHPDLHPKEQVAAQEALCQINEWYRQALAQIEQGVYGNSVTLDLNTPFGHFISYNQPWQGDLASLYPLQHNGEELLLKVVRKPHNNDLLEAEAKALQTIEQGLAKDRLRGHFPQLKASFGWQSADLSVHRINLLGRAVGYLPLNEVIKAFPNGLELGDAAWIFNRIVAALGKTHELGLVHGAILPCHILIDPHDHNAIVIDWCYSVQIGQNIRSISPSHKADYPPEVLQKLPAQAATDLYMAARCMLHLLGAKSALEELPKQVPNAMRALLRACLIPAPHRRYGSAWQLYDDFRELLEKLYGPARFRPFPSLARS